jgi:hypothetical protein
MIDKIKTWALWLYLDTIFWAAMAVIGICFLVGNN